MSFLWFTVAAIFEIAGCYTFWMWYKLDKSPLWLVPGLLSLALFGWILSFVEASFAGRAFAAYGGIYIVMSLVWAVVVEKHMINIQDALGAGLCVVGALLIFFNSYQTT